MRWMVEESVGYGAVQLRKALEIFAVWLRKALDIGSVHLRTVFVIFAVQLREALVIYLLRTFLVKLRTSTNQPKLVKR